MKYLVKYTKRHGHVENRYPRKKFFYEEDAEVVYESLIGDIDIRTKTMRKDLLGRWKRELEAKHEPEEFEKLCTITVVIYSVKQLGEGEIH